MNSYYSLPQNTLPYGYLCAFSNLGSLLHVLSVAAFSDFDIAMTHDSRIDSYTSIYCAKEYLVCCQTGLPPRHACQCDTGCVPLFVVHGQLVVCTPRDCHSWRCQAERVPFNQWPPYLFLDELH